ncbi:MULTISPECIES: hypothetical protein [unclassified Streptomyces]
MIGPGRFAWCPRSIADGGNGVHQAMLGIARLHNLALTGNPHPIRDNL